MEYVELGRTGRRVSRIGFGGATAGIKNYLHAFDPKSPEDRIPVIEAIQKAYELGINYFDTAADYGAGQSEEIFGEALQGIDSDSIFLATKAVVSDGQGVRRSVEESLKRLKRDQVDLLQIHGTVYRERDVGLIFGKGGMLDEMEKIKAERLAKYIGFTCEAQNETLYRLIRCGKLDTMQILYNFIFQHPYDPSWKCGSLYDAEEQGLGIITMRATTSNTFQKWISMVNPENTFDYTKALIQFELSNPLIDVVLIGMRSVKRVIENVQICNDITGRIDLNYLHTRKV